MPNLVLFDSKEQNDHSWTSFTDEVMTNDIPSLVKIIKSEDSITFTGKLKLQEIPGKGFATVRYEGHWDLKAFNQIIIDCVPDNRSYFFILRDRKCVEQKTTLQADIKIQDNQGLIEISKFKEYFRGNEVHSHRTINLDDIVEIGIMIKDGIASPFNLKLLKIYAQA